MSLKAYFKIASFITIIALLYIHMQMKESLNYLIMARIKEKIIHELNDSNGALDHQILTLKSANNLGNQLLDRNNSLQFMDNERVMTITTSSRGMQHLTKPPAHVVNPVWNLFSFLGAQEAKAWE